jgi:transcription termination factor Rho
VIFEEFKGTGNSELVLSRELADRRIWPAIDLTASSTRREELLFSPEMLQASHKLRRDLSGLSAPEAMDQVIARMRRTERNEQLVEQIVSGRA